MNDVARNAAVIDKLVAAYNAGDAVAFAALFAKDAVHANLNAAPDDPMTLLGRAAIQRRYFNVFADYPDNRTEVLHRIAFGAFVIDHESVRRSAGSEPFEVVAIYTLRDGEIARLDFVR